MSTHATVAVLNENRTVTSVYVHSDGYLDYVGRLLTEHYDTEEKVRELISYGGISSLRKEIGEPHGLFDRSHPDWTAFYGRDGGDHDVGPDTYPAKSWPECVVSYEYLFRPDLGIWTWRSGNRDAWAVLDGSALLELPA